MSEGNMIGESMAVRTVQTLVMRAARAEGSVLISGESGTGKKFIARCIHLNSIRSEGSFLSLDCGSTPAEMLAGELFGFEGTSGELRDRVGLIERASGGTLFLDEIDELPPEVQGRLLRLLETNRFTPVGGSQPLAADVRIIAATDSCPIRAAQHGRLREELLYRLAGIPIYVAPLRERQDDVIMLAQYFLDQLNQEHGTDKQFGAPAVRTLAQHSWPGNVRELKKSVARAFAESEDELSLEFAPVEEPQLVSDRADVEQCLRVPVGTPLAMVERWVIEATLGHCQGNKRRAAQALGCSLKTLYNKLALYQREQMGAA
jgi:DNA-binding NtrC family response regulator